MNCKAALSSLLLAACGSPVAGTTTASLSCAHNVQERAPGLNPNYGSYRVSLVFWGSYWDDASTRTPYEDNWSHLANSPAFWLRMNEYYVGDVYAQLGTAWMGSHVMHPSFLDGTAKTLAEDTIRNELQSEIEAGAVAQIDSRYNLPPPETIYVVMLPPSVLDAHNGKLGPMNRRTAHHTYLKDKGYDLPYAVLEYGSDTRGVNLTLSHEIAETATDLDLQSGWLDDNGDEISDICGGTDAWIDGYLADSIWSQKYCKCIGGCVATTCAQQGKTCGATGDGCGHALHCGPPCCVPTQACDDTTCGQTIDNGCGVALTCPACDCVPQCPDCGWQDNGCGRLVYCGKCNPLTPLDP
jgi:hypothetical protein